MLSPQHRVVSGDDYRRIVRTGKRINSPTCVLHVKTTDIAHPARFGFIVTRAVGKAHTRNQIRRRYKALALELVRSGLRGTDIVIRIHPRSAVASFAELRTQFFAAVDKEQLITRFETKSAS